MNKDEFRREMRHIRGEYAREKGRWLRSCADACENVTCSNEYKESNVIALYASILNEPLTSIIDMHARENGKTVAYPRVENDDIIFYQANVIDLVPGTFGISEPDGEGDPIDPQSIDFILIPGLAFTLNHERLGQGKGHYDRFIPKLRKDCHTVGFALDVQIVHEVPIDPWDISMDAVITESGFVNRVTWV